LIDDFSELYNKHINTVYAYLSIRCSSEDDIRDIIQETFIAVWKGREDFNEQSKLSTWIIGIAHNKLSDYYRKVYKRNIDVSLSDDIVDTYIPDDESETEKLDMKMTLEKAILQLAPSDRELLFMIFSQGMNYSEAANILNIPEGTVKSRMSRIRSILRNTMSEDGVINNANNVLNRGGKCNLTK
jgi:RNA polymerase sigma-70 factor, ECF subfamily